MRGDDDVGDRDSSCLCAYGTRASAYEYLLACCVSARGGDDGIDGIDPCGDPRELKLDRLCWLLDALCGALDTDAVDDWSGRVRPLSFACFPFSRCRIVAGDATSPSASVVIISCSFSSFRSSSRASASRSSSSSFRAISSSSLPSSSPSASASASASEAAGVSGRWSLPRLRRGPCNVSVEDDDTFFADAPPLPDAAWPCPKTDCLWPTWRTSDPRRARKLPSELSRARTPSGRAPPEVERRREAPSGRRGKYSLPAGGGGCWMAGEKGAGTVGVETVRMPWRPRRPSSKRVRVR